MGNWGVGVWGRLVGSVEWGRVTGRVGEGIKRAWGGGWKGIGERLGWGGGGEKT